MPAPSTFIVHVADRKTGMESEVKYLASDEDAAMEMAANDGWIVARVELIRDNGPPTASMTHDDLGAISREIRALRSDLNEARNSKLVKQPYSTIAGGILLHYLALIGVGVVLLILWLLFAAFTGGIDRFLRR